MTLLFSIVIFAFAGNFACSFCIKQFNAVNFISRRELDYFKNYPKIVYPAHSNINPMSLSPDFLEYLANIGTFEEEFKTLPFSERSLVFNNFHAFQQQVLQAAARAPGNGRIL